MPTKSEKQHNFMQAAAHDPTFAKEHGISQAVAREFIEADKRQASTEEVSSPQGIGYNAFNSMLTEALNVSNEAKEKKDEKNTGEEIGRIREFAEDHNISEEATDKMIAQELEERASTEDRDLSAPNEQGHANDPQKPKKVMSTPGSMLMQYLDDTVQYNSDLPNDQIGVERTLDDGTVVKVVGQTVMPVVEVVSPAPGAEPEPAVVDVAPAPLEEEPDPALVDEVAPEEPELDADGNPIAPEEPVVDDAAPVDEAVAESEVAVNAEDKSVEQAAKEPPLEEDDETVEDEEPEATDEPAAVDISEDDDK